MGAKSKSARQPAFIRPLEIEGEQVQVSFRITAADKARFDAAQATLRAHGQDMSIADVLRSALRDASAYVEQQYSDVKTSGKDGSANPDQQVDVSFAANLAVEHSSHASVEEWGAPGDGDDQSTTAGAPPLTGSGAPEQETPGVGLAGVGGGHGAR